MVVAGVVLFLAPPNPPQPPLPQPSPLLRVELFVHAVIIFCLVGALRAGQVHQVELALHQVASLESNCYYRVGTARTGR